MFSRSWKARTGVPAALGLALFAASALGDGGGPNNPPAITSINAIQVAGQKFRIYGTVSDETPGNCGVVLSGAAGGVVLCDASGNFDAVFDVATPGGATATPGDGVQSGQAVTLNLTNLAPATTVSASTNRGLLTIRGTVTDEVVAGLTVTLSGKGVNGLSATVLADGTWSTTTTIVPGSHGTVTAKVTDWYGAIGQATTGRMPGCRTVPTGPPGCGRGPPTFTSPSAPTTAGTATSPSPPAGTT